MRITVLTILISVILASACPAAGPQPLAGGSLPEPHALMDRSVRAPGAGGSDDSGGTPPGPESLTDGSIRGMEEDAAPPDTGVEGLEDYYNRKMMTIEGVITAIDLDGGTIGIRNDDGENTYLFDELTHFQVKLRPVEPSALKAGMKMAGLYTQRDGALYISRVVIITGERSRRRRRHRR